MISKPLLILLGTFSVFVAVGQAGGSYYCFNDQDCITQNALYGGENEKCCSDDQCHEDCAWEVWGFLFFFLFLPCCGFICCAALIGGIVYCCVKMANKDSQNVHPVPVVHYSSGFQSQPAYASPPPYNFNQTQPPNNYPTQPQSQPQSSSQAAPPPPPPPADHPDFQKGHLNHGFVQP
ncbi:uncharacterized protein LOC134855892 [Symsagittifera roscoffensis]|uniref:uncharacterized protein LOC134855892 n=1 Tax=Symsagittifera roscoffensis TaxID=84072 RepID=UPI00307B8445